MVASALSFSLMGVCVKQVGGRIPAAEVVLARAIVSVALSWWLLRRAGGGGGAAGARGAAHGHPAAGEARSWGPLGGNFGYRSSTQLRY